MLDNDPFMSLLLAVEHNWLPWIVKRRLKVEYLGIKIRMLDLLEMVIWITSICKSGSLDNL